MIKKENNEILLDVISRMGTDITNELSVTHQKMMK